MGESRTRFNVGVVNKLVVHTLSGTSYMDRFSKSVHLAERLIVLNHSTPVPILMVHEVRN